MKTTGIIVILIALTATAAWAANNEAIEEGLLLNGVDGTVRKVKDVDVWQFIPDGPITLTEEAKLDSNQTLSLLPCSVLEQITDMAGDSEKIRLRLWAMVTNYEKNNYLYGVFFLPVTVETNNPVENETTNDNSSQDSVIPENILNEIRSNTIPDLTRFQQLAKVTGDINLIGRSGYLEQSGKIMYFQPDAFGRNINLNQYRLLPSRMLEITENKMQQTPGRQRYQISGLVTVYKGRQYMLLHRVVRTYSNGNFTP